MPEHTHFGFSHEQWDRMVDSGLDYLETLAARGGDTDYTTFCREVTAKVGASPQPGDHSLAYLLGDIARRSFDNNGVVVTALVHYKDQGFVPGPGFYAICQELGLLPTGALTEDQKLVFLSRHQTNLEAVYRPRRGRSSSE